METSSYPLLAGLLEYPTMYRLFHSVATVRCCLRLPIVLWWFRRTIFGQLSIKVFRAFSDNTFKEVNVRNLKYLFMHFVFDEDAQDLVEYGLILMIIVLGAIAGMNTLASAVSNVPSALMNMFLEAYTS